MSGAEGNKKNRSKVVRAAIFLKKIIAHDKKKKASALAVEERGYDEISYGNKRYS